MGEKSFGCVQKGGKSKDKDVIDNGDILSKKRLSILNGPGNDIVSITNFVATGVHVILITMVRGK